jgi:hypothetical protein
MMRAKLLIFVTVLAGCKLNPLVSDIPGDGPPPPPDAPASTNILPAGSTVPSVSANGELVDQIRINEGLTYATLMANGGVITLSTGKSGGKTVSYWNFGPATLETNNIAVLAPMYVFGTMDQSGVFTPLTTHPPLIDTIPGDTRYSAFRRVIDVPVTAQYAGQLFPSMSALDDAINLGLVGTPTPDGTWVNLPVVLPGLTLQVSSSGPPPIATQQVFAEGYQVDVFQLGTSLGRQPLKNSQVPVGQASSLLSGVATGSPPVLSTTPDPQLVFQYTIPTTPPTMAPNYTPVTTTLTVQLATGVPPSMITIDSDLFTRSSSGAITGYRIDNVANFTVTTTTNNLQLQFTDGEP